MSNILIAFFAYLIDRIFGEFRFIKHPIVIIGAMISWFERRFYQDSFLRGLLLVLFALLALAFVSIVLDQLLEILPLWLDLTVSSLIASMFLAHTMLYDSVKALLTSKDKKEKLSMLVSRDTQALNESDIYKAGVETYAENLSDGVIAPLFYLLLLGLPGIIIYKTINTLDSMVGYKTPRYVNYGKAAARLDDLANFIPSRLTALMIIVFSKNGYLFWNNGHESPNAGHPITAMALSIGVKLGGPTVYHGILKEKPYFGSGSATVSANDLRQALHFSRRFDIMIFTTLFITLLIKGLL